MPKSKTKKTKKQAKEKKETNEINEFKNPNGSINLQKIKKIEELARNGEDISSSLESLKDLLPEEKIEIYLPVANALTYFYDNYISYIWYAFQYHDYFYHLDSLKSKNVKDRKKGLEYLDRHRLRKPGRGWKYLTDSEAESIKKQLTSSNSQTRIRTFQSLPKVVKEGLNIYSIITEIRDGLLDEQEEIMWGAARALTEYYGKFTSVTYGYYMQHVDKLYSKDINEIISGAEFLSYLTTPDMVSDRDERDIGFAIPCLTVLLTHENRQVRVAAFDAIRAAIGEGQSIIDAIPFVINIISGKRKEFQEKSVFILREAVKNDLDISKYLPTLYQLLNSDRMHVKFGIADTLALFHGNRNEWKEFNKLLQHPDKDIVQEVVGTLKHLKYGANTAPYIPRLVELLFEDDKDLQKVTVDVLDGFSYNERYAEIIINEMEKRDSHGIKKEIINLIKKCKKKMKGEIQRKKK